MRLWRSWERFWFRPTDTLPLAIFRISLGCLLVVFFVALFPTWERNYGADGIAAGGSDYLSVFYWTNGLLSARILWVVGLIAAVTFTVGCFTRWSTVALYLLQSSMVHQNLELVNGEDLIFRMLLFYSCFAPLGAYLSVDNWRRRGELPRVTPMWPVRLMQINVALIYALSLPNKLVDDVAWLDGSAFYWTVTNDLWSRWPWPEMFYGGLLCRLATYTTIVVEGTFPLLVWFPRTRLPVLLAATFLQLSVAFVVQNVTFFTLAMVCSFWLYIPGEDLRRWAGAIRRLRIRQPEALHPQL